MIPLLSVIIPTRCRPDGLRRAIISIQDYMGDPENVEFLLGVDDDDPDTLRSIAASMPRCRTKISIAPRRPVFVICNELLALATGKWSTVFNDDAVMMGNWSSRLEEVPTSGFIVQPEIYQLNNSKYPNAEKTGFPIFPTRVWEVFGLPRLPHPLDYAVTECAERIGWKTRFLSGVTIFHDRHKP